MERFSMEQINHWSIDHEEIKIAFNNLIKEFKNGKIISVEYFSYLECFQYFIKNAKIWKDDNMKNILFTLLREFAITFYEERCRKNYRQIIEQNELPKFLCNYSDWQNEIITIKQFNYDEFLHFWNICIILNNVTYKEMEMFRWSNINSRTIGNIKINNKISIQKLCKTNTRSLSNEKINKIFQVYEENQNKYNCNQLTLNAFEEEINKDINDERRFISRLYRLLELNALNIVKHML